MDEKCETCPKYRQATQEVRRAWERVAALEARVTVAESECSRLANELARRYE